MEELLRNEAFYYGMVLGISLYQESVISAHKRKEPIQIGEELYFLQDSRERLEQVLNDICK